MTKEKGTLNKTEGKRRGGRASPHGLIDFLQKNIRVIFQLRSKVHLAKYLSPTLHKRRSLFYSLQDDLSARHRDLNQKCYTFYFISVNLFLRKFILWFWNPCTFLACTTSTARTPAVQLHGNAKNHCLLFKSATCFSHVVFLVLLLESSVLSQYLFFLFSSVCLKNTFRSTSLQRFLHSSHDSPSLWKLNIHFHHLLFMY